MNYGTTPMINSLLRQRDSINNLIDQYSQPQPIQNFINTSSVDLEGKILSNGEDVSNVIIGRRTLFVDEKNGKVLVKEIDGTISKEYDIIVPKDEKDLKIESLEKEIEKLKEVVNNESNIKPAIKIEQSNGNAPKHDRK